MSWSVRLFRVSGIEIKVHLTFVLILVWAAYRWGVSLGGGVGGALFGVVATLLLFIAMLLHELGHSLQAQRQGGKVQGITLLPIGGVSSMEEIPEQPSKELRIALSGPLVNFAIAAVLILLALVLRARAVLTLPELFSSLGQASWRGMLAYLTMSNLLLGLFNLLPAFPMDGGRVLRAILASRMGYLKATSTAAAIGQGFAWLLGLWGFTSGSFTLIFIAVFVWMGAGQESRQVAIKSVLNRMQVGLVMSRQVQSLAPGDDLGKAVSLTLGTFQADFPVVDQGRLVGLLSEGDLLRGLQTGSSNQVSQVMRAEFPIASPQEPLYEAQQRMGSAKLRALPVVEDGRLTGLLTASDVNEAYRLLTASPALAEAAL